MNLLKNNPLHSSRALTLKKFSRPINAILIVSILLDTYVEFNLKAYSYFFFKDLVHLAIVSLLIGFRTHFKLTHSTCLLIISIVSILSITSSLPVRIGMETFAFEPYFLKTEMIIIILTFAVGILVHPTFILFSVVINCTFILLCYFLVGNVYPTEKFLFYGLFVGGSSFAAFIIQNNIDSMYQKIEASEQYMSQQNAILNKNINAKNELIRIIGHDLKTPFAQLQGLVDLLTYSEDKNPQNHEIKQMMLEVTQQGNNLLNNILKWANTEGSKEKLNLEPQFIHILLEDVRRFFSYELDKKGIELINQIDKRLILHLDRTLFETVLRNLISNAIKFSDQHNQITVISTELKEKILLSFRDEGVGMPEETIKAITNKEKLYSKPGTNEEKGTGFGLKICDNIIAKHGGSMSIESKLGNGTCIHVSLPKLPRPDFISKNLKYMNSLG